MKIFFHIGAGKCASSSIQQYFSHNNTRGKFAYATLDTTGKIESGKIIKHKASMFATNYVNSSINKDSITPEFLTNLKQSLSTCSKLYNTIFLSGETLHYNHAQFAELTEILNDYTVNFIFIVRPPVEWINSAWWQWAHWDGRNIDEWITRTNYSKLWLEHYNDFKSLPFTNKVHLLSIQKNIIADICKILKISYADDANLKHNESSSAELLNFLCMKRELRPHHNASILEFVLNKYLKKRSPAAWVLSQANIEHILEKTKPYNLELQKLICNEDTSQNPAWWDISHYAEHLARFDRDLRLSASSMADMLEEAYAIIYDLDCELRRVKNMQKNKN